jgi:hypothetical protein
MEELADAGVGDASFDDNRAIADRQPEVVERVELQCEGRFDLHAALADLVNGGRLKHHYFTLQGAEQFDSFRIPFVIVLLHGIE